jgi:hypothetical protein
MSYNGWSNYETWCVHLWISNDQGSHESLDERCREVYRERYDGKAHGLKSREEATEEASRVVADELKDRYESELDEIRGISGTMWMDLMTSALGEVDWYEIAEAYVVECWRRDIERELTEVETVDTDD